MNRCKPAAILVSLAATTLLLLSVAVVAQPVRFDPDSPRGAGLDHDTKLPYATDHIMVGFTFDAYARSRLESLTERNQAAPDAATGLASVDALARQVGVTRVARVYGAFEDKALARELGLDRVFRFDLPEGADIHAIKALLESDPGVEFAVPDRRAELTYVPNDFSYPANWGHDNTMQFPAYNPVSWTHDGPVVGLPGFDADADMAWDQPTMFGSPSTIIAILDTGVDPAHADLLQVPGFDFGDNDWNPADDIPGVAGHGTCCAGVAAAIPDNNYIAAGVAGGCSIMPLKVGDTAGNLWNSYVAGALQFAADNGADIASMSIGFGTITSDPILDPMLQYAYNQGVVLLAAAGNSDVAPLEYPANSQYVISVGAASPCGERKRSSLDPNGVTCDNETWWGSNFGNGIQDSPGALDVLAPTMLPTTDITGPAGYWPGDFEPWFNGTSCSTPYAAGVCGLILSANPMLTPQEVRDILVNSCTDVMGIESAPGWDMYAGYGLVNAMTAVQMAMAPAAGFSASPTNGCLPLMVNFTDMSGGLVTNWQWSFGDGGVDFVPNPSYVYNMPGTYTVSLTVSGPGGSDTMTVTNLITVDPPSTSDFSASVTSGYAPLTTTFVDASTGSPAAWHWDFGDGFTSTAQFPSHTYNAPGFYTVILTTSNGCGGDTMTKTDYIEVCDVVTAAFTADNTVGADTLTVSFTEQCGGLPYGFSWDFGDGGSSNVPNPVHFYAAPGRYTVRLIASNGCEADTMIATQMITVATTTGVDAPPAAFALEGNHPNPFNPATTVVFSLEREGRARLEVFDAVGRLVAILADGTHAAGRHEVPWRPERASSGLYFARLTADGRTAVHRMMLVR